MINYCFDRCTGNADKPKNYWVNTSGNDLIWKFIDQADAKTKMEMERLIDGESVKKTIPFQIGKSAGFMCSRSGNGSGRKQQSNIRIGQGRKLK